MRTISVCATKGGAGKSTLCVALATHVQCIIGRKVCLLDLDAGGSGTTTAWAAARARGDNPGPEIVKSRSLRADLRRLAARGVDYAFIDTPPTLDDMGLVESAVEVADYVLSPCRPSIADIGVAETIANLAGTMPIGFVLMSVPTGAGWKEINEKGLKALSDVGHVFKSRITERPAHVNNLVVGKTAGETDKVAAAEISALWLEVAQWMK